jgi:hypothetical protein
LRNSGRCKVSKQTQNKEYKHNTMRDSLVLLQEKRYRRMIIRHLTYCSVGFFLIGRLIVGKFHAARKESTDLHHLWSKPFYSYLV